MVNSVPCIIFGSSPGRDTPLPKEGDSSALTSESIHCTSVFFDCPEEGCIRKFVKYGNLLAHLTHGSHKRIAERCSLMDIAKKTYHAKLNSAEEKRILSLSLEADCELVEYLDSPNTEEGWALPVINPPTRFSVKQKQYLNVRPLS